MFIIFSYSLRRPGTVLELGTAAIFSLFVGKLRPLVLESAGVWDLPQHQRNIAPLYETQEIA